MMKSCNNKRRVYKTEYCAEDHFERTGNSCEYYSGDHGTDLPSDRSKNEMSRHNCKYKAAERNHDHRDYLRRDLPEKLFQIYQGKCSQNSWDHLSLISDHVDFDKSEIPFRNIRRRCSSYRIGVQKLSGNKGKAENDSQHLCSSHFLRHRPAYSHRKHMEHSFADQPQKAVDPGPELTDIT